MLDSGDSRTSGRDRSRAAATPVGATDRWDCCDRDVWTDRSRLMIIWTTQQAPERYRNALLVDAIEVRRSIERVASQRRKLPPGGEIPQDFEFMSEHPPIRLSSLFGEKSTLM